MNAVCIRTFSASPGLENERGQPGQAGCPGYDIPKERGDIQKPGRKFPAGFSKGKYLGEREGYSVTPWLALAMALLVLSTAWATALSTSEPLNTASRAVCRSVRS